MRNLMQTARSHGPWHGVEARRGANSLLLQQVGGACDDTVGRRDLPMARISCHRRTGPAPSTRRRCPFNRQFLHQSCQR